MQQYLRRPQPGQIAGDTDDNPENQRIARQFAPHALLAVFCQHRHRNHIHQRNHQPEQQRDCSNTGLSVDTADDGETDIGVEAECALDAGGKRCIGKAEQPACQIAQQHSAERESGTGQQHAGTGAGIDAVADQRTE